MVGFGAAYKSKKTSEVARAYFVLSLCGIKPIVKHNDKVIWFFCLIFFIFESVVSLFQFKPLVKHNDQW